MVSFSPNKNERARYSTRLTVGGYRLRLASGWVRLHLGVFSVMQQMGIIPWTQWLPTPSFFIPFSDTSPIPAPPPIASFTASELLKWAGALAVNAAPLATLCFAQNVWGLIRATVWLSIRTSLPQPYNPTKRSTQRPSEGPQTLEATETVETPRPATPAPQSAPDDEPRSCLLYTSPNPRDS